MGSRTWHWPGVLLGLLLATAGAQADTLRVATLDWAPYVGPDLPGKGLASRILDEALALDGHRAELVFLPWQRALKEAAEGRFDALMPACRPSGANCSTPPSPARLATGLLPPARAPAAGQSRASGKPASVPHRRGRGYVNREDFDADRSLTKDAVTNDWQNLEAPARAYRPGRGRSLHRLPPAGAQRAGAEGSPGVHRTAAGGQAALCTGAEKTRPRRRLPPASTATCA